MQINKHLRSAGIVAAVVGGTFAFSTVVGPASASPLVTAVTSSERQVDGVEVIARAHVDAHALEILRDGDRVFERYTMPSGVVGGEWTIPSTPVEPGEFSLESGGNWTDAKVAEAFGRVGSDVERVVFHTLAGDDVTATIGTDGYWIVGFRGHDFEVDEDGNGSGYAATVTLVDGTSYEVAG
ncbi:hypothetical protein ACIPEP_01085 [Curtobacterium sp. NPDC087082]|uniref:hypothetical protein n=1 Tax=Curtobacterium sp. NPDC087082 TaxID=3363966 RepID=UPI0038068F06